MGFSYNRANNSRREYLKELLTSVYGTTNIKYECKKDYEYVSTGNSIFSLCKFNTRRSMGYFCERFRELFEYSLLNDDFEFTPPRGKGATIRTDSILRNTLEYLQKIGVNFSECSGVKIKMKKLRWILYDAMVVYLIPAIFFVEYKDRYKKDHKSDDIFFQIQVAVMKIGKIINGEFYYIIQNNNTTKVYDSRYKKQKCNYKLPIELSSMDPPSIIEWEDIHVDYNCINVKRKKLPEKILDGFKRVSLQEEQMIDINDILVDKSFYTVSISSMSYEAQKYLKNNIEFYTYIDDADEEKLKAKYKTNSGLKNDIQRKAQEAISVNFKAKETDYYRSIANYIEGALDRISKIDIQIFIKEKDISEYREALSHFSSDANIILDLHIKEYGEESSKEKVKDILINLINNFSDQLEKRSEQLTYKYKTLLRQEIRDNHKIAIDKYLSSATSLSPSIRKVHPELTTFEGLKKIVQNYHDSL